MDVDKEARVVARRSPAADLPIITMTIQVHTLHIIVSISRCLYRIHNINHQGKTSLLIATLFRIVRASESTEVCRRLHKITKSLELQTVIL